MGGWRRGPGPFDGEALAAAIRAVGVVPVVEIDDASAAAELAEALLEGGIACAEITFRTGAAAAAIEAVRRSVPDILVGAGTVLTPGQAEAARDAGADFLVSPGFGSRVVERAKAIELPLLPGVATPTEIQMALDAGISTVKLFPASALGGIAYVRALAGPFREVGFVPTGGIGPGDVAAYLAEPGVVACGGSWLVRREWIAARDFAAVTTAAREAAAIVARVRAG